MKTRNPKKLFPETNVPAIVPKPDDRVTETRRYKLITPLFGGGVEAQKADPITIIRGASVRGQLRFWWRATRGGQFNDDLSSMRERENAIWGSAAKKDEKNSGPSKVNLAIKILNEGKPFPAVDSKGNSVTNIGAPRSVYSYVAFPLRDTQGAKVMQNVEFELTIRYPGDLDADVQAALWAWETFGGIGARTRRGFGALQLISVSLDDKVIKADLPNIEQVRIWISNNLKKHVVSGYSHNDVPHLTQATSFVLAPNGGKPKPIEAWRYLIDKLKEFRQARYDKNGRPYGRSKWSEPDEIRRLTNHRSPGHNPNHPGHKFPRGQFGLPIIFKFKDDDERRGDPPQTTLQGADNDRFASALILRPLVCVDGAVGLALRLVSPKSPPGGYMIKSGDQTNPVEVCDLSSLEANQIEPLNGQPDVIEAFLEYLKK